MEGFSADWLGLREPFDATARDRALAVSMASTQGPYHVLDLGAGTGANVRYLAPLLGGEQIWTLIDHDAGLLKRVPEILRKWAWEHGWRFHDGGDEIDVRGQDFSIVVRCERHDLSRSMDALPWTRARLVTASALLDLVSPAWFRRLMEQCRASSAVVYFTLTYNGHVAWTPPLADDFRILEALNRHQCTDKGFDTAMGPTAAPWARKMLEAAGYRVEQAPSDWHIGPDGGAIQARLIEDWSRVARTVSPHGEAWIETWRQARLAELTRGRSRLRVGHMDLLAVS